MKYNKVYLLHTMKTGGRFIRKSVLFPLRQKLRENGISLIIPNKDAHTGWHSRIDDNTYILTTFRDPVEQAVSFYSHVICLDDEGNMKNEYDSSKLTSAHLFDYIDNSSAFPNYQARAYFHSEGDRGRVYKRGFTINTDELYNKINRVNLFMDFKDIKGKEIEIQKKLIADLEVDIDPILVPSRSMFNHESKILYESLTDSEKNALRKYNSLDQKLYETIDFWIP